MLRFSILIGVCAAATMLAQEETTDHRIRKAADAIQDIMSTPDKSIPQSLFDKAKCIVIVPGMMKAAFIVGGEFGHGFASCRTASGKWGPPAAMKLAGGSFGLQLGGESTDVVLLIMNQHGMDRLLSDKFKIGADASAAAGPVGRNAAADTDILARAEILSWSRTRGLFGGVSLDGTVVERDRSEDRKLYGSEVTSQQIIAGNVHVPPAARVLEETLDRYHG